MPSFSKAVRTTEATFREVVHASRNGDFVLHEFTCMGAAAALMYIDGMANCSIINLNILKPCIEASGGALPPDERVHYIMAHVLEAAGARIETDFDKALAAMLSGRTLLIIDGFAGAVTCDTIGYEHRSVSEPVTESVIVGPHQGFNEALRTNITLLRRIIPSAQLISEPLTVGRSVKTRIALMYMEGIARTASIDCLRSRINALKIDAITDIGQIEQLIEDAPYSIIPQHLMTERPDRAASCLLDGQIVLLCDGSPSALVAPITFFHLLHAPDDANMRWEYGTFARIIRIAGMLMSMLLPGLYIAIVLFHPEVIPLGLLTSIIETHAKVPFSTLTEVLILILSFDLIQESATRVPDPLGSTLGIVGALILGEASVSADIISPVLVIIAALAGLGNYAIPDYQFGIGIRILRLAFIFSGSAAGLFGISLCGFFCVIYLCALTSLGQPFMAPAAPYRPHNPDMLLRLPIFMQRRRLFTARSSAAQRAYGSMRQWKRARGRAKK